MSNSFERKRYLLARILPEFGNCVAENALPEGGLWSTNKTESGALLDRPDQPEFRQRRLQSIFTASLAGWWL